MKNIYILALLFISTISCKDTQQTELQWVHQKTIALEGVNPIGIAQGNNGIWISDGDHFRVVLVDQDGVIKQVIDSLDRPMHISARDGDLVIPQYGNDEVLRFRESATQIDYNTVKTIINAKDSLDAPAGVDIQGAEIAIADFYNNQIHYSANSKDWITFGKEGKADGDFYYPTDVQITEGGLWVADAYNNRLQKFDKTGKHLLTVGQDQNMNAATGIFISEQHVFSTDFENDRVLVFDKDGTFKQVLSQDISKPTDMIVIDGVLYVGNYKGKSLSLFEQKEVAVLQGDNKSHNNNHDDDN